MNLLRNDRCDTSTDPSGAHRHTSRCYWDLYRAAWRCSGPAAVDVVDVHSAASEGEQELPTRAGVVLVTPAESWSSGPGAPPTR